MIKIIAIIMFFLIFIVPLGLNLLVLNDDFKRRRRRKSELSNLLPVLKNGKVNGGKLEGDYDDLPVEIFFKDYLTNHAFDHSLFHIRFKRVFPFEFQFESKIESEGEQGASIPKSPAEVHPDNPRWSDAIDRIMQVYHEVGTSEKTLFLQVVGTIKADSQEEFFLRPENVTQAMAAMEAIYRATEGGAKYVDDGGGGNDDKTDQSGADNLTDGERSLS